MNLTEDVVSILVEEDGVTYTQVSGKKIVFIDPDGFSQIEGGKPLEEIDLLHIKGTVYLK